MFPALRMDWRYAAPALVAALVAAGLVPLVHFAVAQGGGFALDAYAWRVLAFTLWQASLSTALSVGLAIPAARALASRKFAGRSLLLGLLVVPQALPAIVVVLALVQVYGRAGWLGGVIDLYGLAGILLAHVFFNLPLATRFFLTALENVRPENQWLAEQLGFDARARWRHVEWPRLRPVLPGVAALIFLLCAASFVVVLTFGGPSATTLEVAIYQALRFDFDVSRAVTLSMLQMMLCVVLLASAGRMMAALPATPRLRVRQAEFRIPSGSSRWDSLAVIGLLLLLLPPLAALLVSGLGQFSVRAALVQAALTSCSIAILSASLALVLAWPLSSLQARATRARGLFAAIALLGLIVPPAVLATGWFVLARSMGPSLTLSIVSISTLNALMALPFCVTILANAMAETVVRHDSLCGQLGISGFARLRIIDGPALRRPLAQAFLMAFVISFGDLTAVLLLGSQGLVTLPALVAAEMGNYRSAAAQGTALLLAALCLAGSLIANHLGQPSGET